MPITCLAASGRRHVTVIAMNHASISIAQACAINTKRRPAKHGRAYCTYTSTYTSTFAPARLPY